jgi:hypothetical protein
MTRTKPAKGAGEDHPRRALSTKIVMTQLRCHLMPGFVERLE